METSTICCHQFVLECQRCEKVRFVATSLPCSIVIGEKKYDLVPPVCAQRWEEVRFDATSLCSIVKDGKKYVLLPPVCARLSNMGRLTICRHQFLLQDGKKYDMLPPVCGPRLSKMGGSTICCHQFVLDCQRWEEVRFVTTSLRCSIVKDGKKYDLLPPVCARLSKMGRSTVCCHQFDLLPPVCARLPKMGRRTICCHQFAARLSKMGEEVRFVCARLPKMRKSTICCHQFLLDCQRWEKVRFVATSLCSIVKDEKKYDLLPPVFAQRWEEVRFCCHQFVPESQKWEEARFVATSL